jgi:muconolactone delta-isomerase
MAAYLFELELADMTEDMESMIPLHREYINKLFAQGRILSYSVSANRTMVWCVINAEDEQEAMQLVLEFPLFQYFTEVTCNPLLFHNTLPATLPAISLN